MQLTQDNRRLALYLSAIAFLLLLPLVAMQFTEEVNWTGGDFLVMGGLLLLVALGLDGILRVVKGFRNRIILVGLLLIVFLIVWAELAVGVFGTPFAGS